MKTGFNIFKEKMKQSENNLYSHETKFKSKVSTKVKSTPTQNNLTFKKRTHKTSLKLLIDNYY